MAVAKLARPSGGAGLLEDQELITQKTDVCRVDLKNLDGYSVA
jgi:hypothetical protein